MALKMDEVSSPQLAYKFTTISFDPEKYVQDLSAQCDTDAELQEHRQRIQTLSEETALCLKKNVYKNYVQFIETSREISYLEAEMYQLGHLLAEQRSILSSQQDMSLFGTQDSSSSTKPIKKDEKGNSSIESVEGLSSVLDTTDLNCVCEGDLLEVELGTYLPRHKVHAFLLHDSMVIASLIPNRRGPVRYKFQSLFELENVAVVNMTSADGLKDAFKILLFPETHIYQAENSQVKNEWLEKIEECKKNFKLKLEQDVTQGDPSKTSEATLKSSYSSNPFLGDRKNPFLEDHNTPFPNNKGDDYRNPFMESKSTNPFDEDENNPFSQESASSSSEGKLRTESFKSIKLERGWLRDLPEDLDMCIAQRDFERAMELIDQTNHYLKENSSCQALKEIKVRVDRRVKQLVEALIQELDCSRSFLLHVGPRATRRAVSLLVRLGRAAEACDLFLRNRSEAIKHNLRQLKIEGATSLYIAKLSGAFFSSLIDTGREFERVFSNNKGFSSAFVVWANSELQNFVSRFSCQVFRREMSLAAIGVCVSMAKQQCEKLHEIGLDLTFSMQHMLLRDLVEALLDTRDQMEKFSRHRAAETNWTAMDFAGQKADDLERLCGEMESCGIEGFSNLIVGGCRVELSSATVAFTKGVLGFMADGLTVNTPQLQQVFVDCIADLFQSQVVMFDSILKSGRFVHQHEFILKNAYFVLEIVLRVVKKKLKIGGYSGRFFELQGELKRLQAITPSNDPPEADGQARR